MYTTSDEHGILNNFAKEPKMYLADAPTAAQKWRYALQGGAALLLMAGVVTITAIVS